MNQYNKLTCQNCKYADKKKRYCHSWVYPRCESFDWCYRFEPDTPLNIIIRAIWWDFKI